MNGIIIIDKPQNYTSFDVIAILPPSILPVKIKISLFSDSLTHYSDFVVY